MCFDFLYKFCLKCFPFKEELSEMYHKYEGWNFNFGNTPLDWIQELLE